MFDPINYAIIGNRKYSNNTILTDSESVTESLDKISNVLISEVATAKYYPAWQSITKTGGVTTYAITQDQNATIPVTITDFSKISSNTIYFDIVDATTRKAIYKQGSILNIEKNRVKVTAYNPATGYITLNFEPKTNFMVEYQLSYNPAELPAGKYMSAENGNVIIENIDEANEIQYDNITSGLSAENVQDAIDEIQAEKEPNLPITPDLPDRKYLNGNREWREIAVGSGGYAANLYFTEITSAVVPAYKQLSYTLETSATVKSVVLNNNEILIQSYIFDTASNVTTFDAGSWFSTFYAYVSSSVGITQLKLEVYKRTSGGIETLLFSKYSDEINNTSFAFVRSETIQSSFAVDLTDRLVLKVYGKTTANINITLYYSIGDGNASYVNTPLALRHSQLRGKNDEQGYQHITDTEKTVIIDDDMFAVRDNTTTFFQRMKWSNLKTAIKTYYDSVTTTLTNKTLTSPVINTTATGTGVTTTGEASKLVKTDTLGDIYERGNRVAEDFKATSNKPSVFLNGTNAYISVADNANINFGTGTFSIIHESTFATGNTNRYLIYKFESNAGYVLRHESNNKIVVVVGDGTNVFTLTSTNAITDGKFHVIGYVHGVDSTSSKLFIDGVEDLTVVKTGTFPTLSKLNALALSIGSSTLGGYHKNETRLNRIFNYALTASQVQNYSFGSLEYSDVGGNNTDLTAGNGSFATDTTGWWVKEKGTLTWNSGTQDATFTVDGTVGLNDIYKATILSVGKRYRISFNAKSSNLSTTLKAGNGNGAYFTAIKNPTLSNTYQNYVFEGISRDTLITIYFGSGLVAGTQITVDDLVVQQIGAVLDLPSDSIANTGWFDKSGNNLHATYTNALPFNLQNYKPRIQGYSADMRGANVASATTITPTGELFHVTGTTAIATINIPYTGFNGSITIIPDGIFTWTTAGNIALAGTAVVSKTLKMTYDSTTAKWYPDYIA